MPRGAGVTSWYDEIALTPGQRLWEQIAARIEDPELDGWCYLLTPASIDSQPCREELAYALDRALRSRGRDFPLIGLLNGIPIATVPAPLRVRLCVDLGDPDWANKVAASLRRQPPPDRRSTASRFNWIEHDRGDSLVIEVGPRFGQLVNWRFAFPADAQIEWGSGAARTGSFSTPHLHVCDGSIDVSGRSARWVGASDALSPSVSAYIAFARSERPEFVAFGTADDPYSLPRAMEEFKLRR